MAKFKPKPFKVWLDALARVVVKERDDWTCQKCLKNVDGRDCHAHHIKTRKYNNLRWDMNNLITLCSGCHTVCFHESPEGDVWFAETYPARYEYIIGKPKHIGSWKEDDFLEVEEYLLQKCVDLEVAPYRRSEAHAKRLIKKLKGKK